VVQLATWPKLFGGLQARRTKGLVEAQTEGAKLASAGGPGQTLVAAALP